MSYTSWSFAHDAWYDETLADYADALDELDALDDEYVGDDDDDLTEIVLSEDE